MTSANSDTIFITGGCGFIGKYLIKKLVERDSLSIYLLIRQQSEEKIKKFLQKLKPKNKIKIIIGDLRLKNLGIKPKGLKEIKEKTTVVYHLGAKFNVDISRETAKKTNVIGTRNVLKLASEMKRLKTLSHISTIYVCGLREGIIFEEELIPSLGFRNFYEESKYKAEKLVREHLNRLPIIIIRPSQVVGDSKTGQTDKFDGPYKLIRAIDQGKFFFLPGPCQAPFNILPVDFVVNAIIAVSSQKKNIGKTFHLCDPHPPTALEFINLTCKILGVRKPFLRVPLLFFKVLLSIPYLGKYVKIKKSAIAFLNQNIVFDTTNILKALKGTKVKIPRVESYLPNILHFYKENKQNLFR